ncbi:MAG: TPM domain-containing protein [Pseudomonadota bacterium]
MFRFALIFLMLPSLLWAQSYPDYESTTVNDFAGLISTEAEARISAKLTKLRDDTGVEMTVVTLSRQEVFAPDISFEDFATGLFNTWGVGDDTDKTGVMILVIHTDKAMRIALGDGFGGEWNSAAARAIDRTFLPAFKEDRYEAGIEAGVTDTIATVVTPFLAGEDAPSGGGTDSIVWVVLGVLGAGFSALIFRDKFVKLKRCPNCGTRGLNRTRKVRRKATKSAKGDGEMTTRCSNCEYRSVVPYSISRISSSSSSSFGGGSSSGGGASGRW